MKNENQRNQVKQADFIRGYFENLPSWDGIDHINKLSSYLIPIELSGQINEKQRINYYLKKMLVKMIANSLGTNINKHCLTLVGEKGIGKTKFLTWLLPPGLRFVFSDKIEATNHDRLHLTENFIYQIEDLSQLTTEDAINMNDQLIRGQLLVESILTSKETTEKRICNIVASSSSFKFFHHEDFLKRCVCFYLKGINPNYNEEIDILQVWAQAFALYYSSEYSNKINEKDKVLNKLANGAYYCYSLEMRYKEIYPDQPHPFNLNQ